MCQEGEEKKNEIEEERGQRLKSSSNSPLFPLSRLVVFAMDEGKKIHLSSCDKGWKGGEKREERRATEREDGMGDHTPHYHITSDSFTHTLSIPRQGPQ